MKKKEKNVVQSRKALSDKLTLESIVKDFISDETIKTYHPQAQHIRKESQLKQIENIKKLLKSGTELTYEFFKHIHKVEDKEILKLIVQKSKETGVINTHVDWVLGLVNENPNITLVELFLKEGIKYSVKKSYNYDMYVEPDESSNEYLLGYNYIIKGKQLENLLIQYDPNYKIDLTGENQDSFLDNSDSIE